MGVRRVSLNFAMFRSALARGERLGAGPVLRVWRGPPVFSSRWFQIESLYKFGNAKFQPRWEPRFLVYPRARDLPRIGLAVMRAEAFITLELPRAARARRTTTLTPARTSGPRSEAAEGTSPGRVCEPLRDQRKGCLVLEPGGSGENGPLHLPEPQARFHAEPFDELVPEGVVDAECIGGAATAVESHNQIEIEVLPQRLVRDQTVGLTDHPGVPAEPQFGFHPQLVRGIPLLVQLVAQIVQHGQAADVGEGRPAPQRDGGGQQLRGSAVRPMAFSWWALVTSDSKRRRSSSCRLPRSRT